MSFIFHIYKTNVIYNLCNIVCDLDSYWNYLENDGVMENKGRNIKAKTT